jgi:hypothetical protein
MLFILKNPVQLTLRSVLARNLTRMHSVGIIAQDQEINNKDQGMAGTAVIRLPKH